MDRKVGQVFQYVDDYDLRRTGRCRQYGQARRLTACADWRCESLFLRGTDRGQQLKADYQKMYDDGIQVALKFLGE